MPFARVIQIDACSVQLAGAATIASAFKGLIYEILISRRELVAAITMFAISLVSHLVIDTGTVHQGGLQVLCKYLQEVYSNLSGGVWTYTEAELLKSSAILLERGPGLTAGGCRLSLLIQDSLLEAQWPFRERLLG